MPPGAVLLRLRVGRGRHLRLVRVEPALGLVAPPLRPVGALQLGRRRVLLLLRDRVDLRLADDHLELARLVEDVAHLFRVGGIFIWIVKYLFGVLS